MCQLDWRKQRGQPNCRPVQSAASKGLHYKLNAKTIVFCCNSLWGLLNFRGRMIEALVQDGHRVVLVASRDVPVEQVTALGAEFVEWTLSPRAMNPLSEAKAIFSLWQIYRHLAPDIVFNFTIKAVVYGGLVARLSSYKCVSVITGLGYLFLSENLKSRLGKLLYKATLHGSMAVWFLNNDDAAYFERHGLTAGVSVRVLPGEGIDIERFSTKPLPSVRDKFVFLMIARLVKDKGIYEYAEAARAVKARHPQAHFRLIGPMYAANGAAVQQHEIDDWRREGIIDYRGSLEDVRGEIEQAHCLVLPSYREGLPRVLMEGAAMGRPAITTDVTGCRDVVVNRVTGLLCEAQNATSLAASMEEMLTADDQALQSMAAAARERVIREFDDRHLMKIYRATIEGSQHGCVDHHPGQVQVFRSSSSTTED